MRRSAEIAGRPSRVLIVDDIRENREVLELMLAPEGLVITSAESGEEALAMVIRQAPDLILLDIMMPGLNGYDVIARLKGVPATRSIPIIVVSAMDDRQAMMFGLQAGAEDFLIKPVSRAELVLRVRNLLRLKAYGDFHDNHSKLLEAEVRSRTADLAESEGLYRSTFDAAPVGIVHLGRDGQWLRVNQRLCEMLGYSRDELQQGAVRAQPETGGSAREVEAILRKDVGTPDRHVVDERKYRRKDGGIVWTRVNTSVHRDAEGQPLQLISVIEDITEQRALEAQARQAGKMDAIGRLASGVAHDFNNLLTIILGFTEVVSADPSIARTHATALGEVTKAAQCAANLTKQLLAFSRQQVLQTEAVDVNEIIAGMGSMLGRLIGRDVEIALALAPDLAFAFADRSQLEQVVMNLVVNARDAMPTGGRVTIETAEVDLESSTFHEEAIIPGRYVMLAVSDTGCGMSKESRRRLFEPFFTTKAPGTGTGLGLSITYGIVKQSKGYIWVYSEPGQGTVFKVYLPRCEAEVAAPVVRPEVAGVARASGTVLLVDEEPGVRRFLNGILDQAGYEVLEAASGAEAEKLFAGHAHAIDLVVTDVIMPECSGPELIHRLRSQVPGLRALYMSGYTAQSGFAERALEPDAPFIQKPFAAAEFARLVREAMGALPVAAGAG